MLLFHWTDIVFGLIADLYAPDHNTPMPPANPLPLPPTLPTAFIEKDRNLRFGTSVHHEGLFVAIKAMFEFQPLS